MRGRGATGGRRARRLAAAMLGALAAGVVPAVHAATTCDLPRQFGLVAEQRGATEDGGPGVVIVRSTSGAARAGDRVRQANGLRVDACGALEVAASEALAKGLALMLGVDRGGGLVGVALTIEPEDAAPVTAEPAAQPAGVGRADDGAPVLPHGGEAPAAAAPVPVPAPRGAAEPASPPRVAAAPEPPPAPVATATPAPVAELPPAAGASSGLRQVADAAAITLAEMEQVTRLTIPPAIYDQRLQHTEVVLRSLAFERDLAGAEVRAVADEVLGYYRTAQEIWAAQRSLDERRDSGQRARSGTAVPYFSDGPVPGWIARHPFLRETLIDVPTATRLPLPGESSGTWEPDRAIELLWERARERRTQLADFAAGS